MVLSDRYYEVVDLIVAITKEEDEPPERMFYADVIQADAQLDLAVIKVRSDLSGGAADFASLGIQPVPLGDSESLSLGDSIIIIGYPGIGGETITLTPGRSAGSRLKTHTATEPISRPPQPSPAATAAAWQPTPRGRSLGFPARSGRVILR